jgi:hypothetical protein
MIVLNATSDIIQVTTTSANALDVHCTYVDNVTAAPYTSARQNTAIAAAATTTVLSSPASSTQRQLKVLTAVAKGGANNVAPKLFDGSSTFNLFGNGIPLLANETLAYEDARGWFVLDATGQLKQVGATGPTGPTGITGTAGSPGGDGEDAPDPMMIPGPQGLTGVTGPQGAPGIAAFPGSDPEEPDAAWIALPSSTFPVLTPPRDPAVINALDLWGHSYLDDPLTDITRDALATNDNTNFGYIFASACGVPSTLINNHAVSGSLLTKMGIGGANGVGNNFPKFLAELTVPKKQNFPYSRAGGCHLICTGINDIGNTTAANQALLRSTADDGYMAVISKMRASAIYTAQSGTNQVFGANWSNAAAAAQDWTSGLAKQCTVVDSAGTSTVTFTIPFGYKGEPITFAICSQNSASSLQITWGGTITGTSGIVGTVSTLSSRSTDTQGIVGFRWTAATNGLSAANCGQTITFKVSTITGTTCYYDGVWIEALKAAPILVCNVPRLPQRTITMAFGDGVTTGVTTSFTSAVAQFNSASGGLRDFAGAVIAETDAQGAFTGSANTLGSVTSPSVIVLGSNAALAKTSVQYTIQRQILGYSSGLYWTINTNFTTATVASHSAADADITNWNAMLATVVARFDSMVQIVDLDAAIGGDLNIPPNVYSFFSTDGGHPNDLGAQFCAYACWKAANQLVAANDLQPIGPLQAQASPIYAPAAVRNIRRNLPTTGTTYLPDGACQAANTVTYTAATNDAFAYPFFVTEPTEFWGNLVMEMTNAGNTVVAAGWYDDANGSGFPKSLRLATANFTMGGVANTINTIGAINRPVHRGLNWLIVTIQAQGATPATFRTMYGPSPNLPAWTGNAAATGLAPIAWKGSITPGSLPSVFPATTTLAGINTAAGITAPLIGITVKIQ